MKDNECVQFLQWALPQMHMRWPGFRKVRSQVCKRIERRMRQMHIDGFPAYKTYLHQHSQEWLVLNELSRITISRFYRDKAVFAYLMQQILPDLAQQVMARGDTRLKIWSAGCASGEEPYTVSLMWWLQLHSNFPDIELSVTATDAGDIMLTRAQQACYSFSSIKNLPPPWRELAFRVKNESYCLKPQFRQGVQFFQQDIRAQTPEDRFDLVLCRNLVFTYFDSPLQQRVLERVQNSVRNGGVLVTGIHENLPPGSAAFVALSERLKIYQKTGNPSCA